MPRRLHLVLLVLLVLASAGCGSGDGPAERAPQDGPPVDGQPIDGGTSLDRADELEAGDGAPPCTHAIGAGSLAGSLGGQMLAATHAAGVKARIGGLTVYYVGFFATGGPCTSFYPDGPAPVLYIHLCDVSPGTVAVGSNCLHKDGGTGLSVSNEVKIPRPGTHAQATSGTVTIEAFDELCGGAVRGSFAVSFAGQQVQGSFATASCGTVYPTR